MVLTLENSSRVLDIAVCLTLRKTGSSIIEVVGYYADRYESIGVYLRIEPNSTGILPVQVYLLEKGKPYSVLIKTKDSEEFEGPFKIEV